MPQSTFELFGLNQFEFYLKFSKFKRKVTFLQNHHTYNPNYVDFKTTPDHMHWLESMRNFHMRQMGWKDIGQNITIFPDGVIAVCRPIENQPAGILGANKGAICIENLGNFDKGHDEMSEQQKRAIVQVNALLCWKFNFQANAHDIVYHHWFDRNGKRLPDKSINSGEVMREDLQKSCPGTGFFNGNTIKNAQDHFYPLIHQTLARLRQNNTLEITYTNRKVNAVLLNVRSGNSVSYPVIKRLRKDEIVQVFAESAGWSRINPIDNEWVTTKFLINI